MNSLLLNGKIPAHTICPFRQGCIHVETCVHTGYNHTNDFSCGLARAYDATTPQHFKDGQSLPENAVVVCGIKVAEK